MSPPPPLPHRPTVSVLLPVRDGAAHLAACLDSLFAQTFADFEVVAVDDGSTDGTAEILAAAAERDRRLTVIATGPRGLVAALSTGLVYCRGDLVARMDADDLAHPERLELQVAALVDDPALDVVSCLVRSFPDGAVSPGQRRYEAWLNSLVSHEEIVRERFVESPLPHPSVIVRRRVLEEVGGYRQFPPTDPWPEDYDLWLRLAARGARFGKVPRVLLHWREHPRRLTRTDDTYRLQRFLAAKAHHLARGPLAADGVDGHGRRPPLVLWGAGQTGRRLGKFLEREGVPPVAWIDIDPRRRGKTLRERPIAVDDSVGRQTGEVEALLERLRDGSGGAPPPVVVTAVAAPGARDEIRARLGALGLIEGEGFWCAA